MALKNNQAECLDKFIPAMGKKRIYLWIQEGAEFSSNLLRLPWREVWTELADVDFKREIQFQQANSGLWPVERQVLPVVRDPDESITGFFLMIVFYRFIFWRDWLVLKMILLISRREGG